MRTDSEAQDFATVTYSRFKAFVIYSSCFCITLVYKSSCFCSAVVVYVVMVGNEFVCAVDL